MNERTINNRWLNAKAYTIEELLHEKGFFVYTNIGTSMLPLLRQHRDVIEIRKKNNGRCHKYDVILYKRGSRYILHRILRVFPDGYLIAGDHNTFIERDVSDEMILGIMTRIIRNGNSIYPTDWKYKLYVHLWCDLYPVRIAILHISPKAKAVLCKVKNYCLEKRNKHEQAE